MGAIYTKMQKCLLISLLAQFSAGQFCSGQTTQPSHDNLPLVREIGHATDSELGELLRHECTDGALYAAWERMSRGLVNDRQLAIERLLGFVEGRLRVNIPSAWESRIANMEIMDDRSVRWGLISSVGSFSIQNHFRISMTPGFDFQSYDGIWHLTSDYLNVPLSMFDESAKQIQVAGSVVSCERMALAADGDDGLIIGLSFDAPDTYPLIRLNSRGNLAWNEQVNCRNNVDETTLRVGIMNPTAEITVTGEMVLVFGTTRDSAYIEGFSLDTGEPIFRFSTWDWTTYSRRD